MCGRYTYRFTWSQIHEQLSGCGLALDEATLAMTGPAARFNVAPTTDVPVIVARSKTLGSLSAAMMRWWLVPHWAQEASTKYPMFNARSATAATKPAFRGPMKYRRCVLPASGFYEWKKIDDKTKQPHYITRADGETLLLAGLWDCGRDELETCTILTTTPNAEMSTLHHRMPCILEASEVGAWMDPTQQDSKLASDMLRPAPDGVLEIHRVSRRVGNARVDEPSLIEPASDEP